MTNNKIHLMVALPGSEMNTKSVMSLVGLVGELTQCPLPNVEEFKVTFHNVRGSILPLIRQQLVEKAQTKGCTHILFIDADMTYPSSLVWELLQHGLPIVAANCATKALPSSPTARLESSEKFQGELCFTTPEKSEQGLEQVWRVGTGIMLIEMDVFSRMSKPYFPITYDEANDYIIGEDWNFCKKAEELEIPIFVDHHLSIAIGHVGNYEFTAQEVLMTNPEVCDRYQLQFLNDTKNEEPPHGN
jgi:hypothetical protein